MSAFSNVRAPLNLAAPSPRAFSPRGSGAALPQLDMGTPRAEKTATRYMSPTDAMLSPASNTLVGGRGARRSAKDRYAMLSGRSNPMAVAMLEGENTENEAPAPFASPVRLAPARRAAAADPLSPRPFRVPIMPSSDIKKPRAKGTSSPTDKLMSPTSHKLSKLKQSKQLNKTAKNSLAAMAAQGSFSSKKGKSRRPSLTPLGLSSSGNMLRRPNLLA